MSESLNYTLHGDGRVTVERFPERIRFNEGLFRSIDSSVRLDGDRLYITCSNGRATYVRASPDDEHGGSWWTRLYATIEG